MISAKSLKNKHKHELFQYFNREASLRCTNFVGKHYSRKYLNVKIPHSKLFRGEYLLPGGSTYLLVNKYWGSSYFSVKSYFGELFSGEYLLTVTPAHYYWQISHLELFFSTTALVIRGKHTPGYCTPFIYICIYN